MGEACCQKKSEDLKNLAKRQAKVLWTVLIVNAVMFLIEFSSGFHFESLALSGDSLDMLGDAIAYGSSLYVIGGSMVAKARASQLKGLLMVVMGLIVVAQAIYRTFFEGSPEVMAMGLVGALALLANFGCLLLLSRHRRDDINFNSVWVCSRNDIIANLLVLAAAGLVAYTKTPWPDLLVGVVIAGLFIKSSLGVFAEAKLAINQSA